LSCSNINRMAATNVLVPKMIFARARPKGIEFQCKKV